MTEEENIEEIELNFLEEYGDDCANFLLEDFEDEDEYDEYEYFYI
jgi:hypothetical protein